MASTWPSTTASTSATTGWAAKPSVAAASSAADTAVVVASRAAHRSHERAGGPQGVRDEERAGEGVVTRGRQPLSPPDEPRALASAS